MNAAVGILVAADRTSAPTALGQDRPIRRGFALSGYPPEADGRTAGIMSTRLNTLEIYLSTAPPESAQSLKPPRL